MSNNQLKVELENGVLTISIGVNIIRHATDHGIAVHGLKIADKDRFIDELKHRLQYKEEDGTTPVHRMFDQCALAIAEDDDWVIEDLSDD